VLPQGIVAELDCGQDLLELSRFSVSERVQDGSVKEVHYLTIMAEEYLKPFYTNIGTSQRAQISVFLGSALENTRAK